MQRYKKLVLAVLGLCVMGGGTIWFSFGSFARSQAKAVTQFRSRLTPQRRLAIEIGMTKPFTVPAANAGHTLETFLRVPTNATRGPEKSSFSAIKLAPRMVGDKIEVTVSVLSGDAGAIKSCKDWGILKESRVKSYTLGEGEQVTVSELSNLGPNFTNGTVTFRAVWLNASPDDAELDGGCGCGRCVDLECCPNKGACIGCGQCGDVCCRITSAGN